MYVTSSACLESLLDTPDLLRYHGVRFGGAGVTCSHCRVTMKEERGVHHGQRKFRCPRCRRVKMQSSRPRGKT